MPDIIEIREYIVDGNIYIFLKYSKYTFNFHLFTEKRKKKTIMQLEYSKNIIFIFTAKSKLNL